MKRHWLRGMLLGVSLALLLGAGAALAATLSITSDQTCFECQRVDGKMVAFWDVVISGLDRNYYRCHSIKGPAIDLEDCDFVGTETESRTLAVVCGVGGGQASLAGSEVTFESDAAVQQVYGTYTWRVWQVETGESDEVSATLAEVCQEEQEDVEFVPEPGSILLLGSGLLSLAGYAGLRWRTRE